MVGWADGWIMFGLWVSGLLEGVLLYLIWDLHQMNQQMKKMLGEMREVHTQTVSKIAEAGFDQSLKAWLHG